MALWAALRTSGPVDHSGVAASRAGYGSLLFGLLIVSVSYAAASAAGDTRLLRRIYLATGRSGILIDLGIITMGAGDGLAWSERRFRPPF